TDRRVIVARAVGSQRTKTGGCIGEAGGVIHERLITVGCVKAASVAKERVKTSGRVEVAAVVDKKCTGTDSGVSRTAGVRIERKGADSRVVKAVVIIDKRGCSSGCVVG